MTQRHALRQIENGLGRLAGRLFGEALSHEAVLQAARTAFEDAIAADSQHQAPLHLTLYLHPRDYAQLLADYPFLQRQIIAMLAEQARQAGVPMQGDCAVECLQAPDQARGEVRIFARVRDITDKLEQVDLSPDNQPPRASLWQGGQEILALNRAVVNIGRQHDNHLVLDDPRVSRYHCQVRLRFGRYRIYDLNSRHGLYLNGQSVSEQDLTHGDVLSLGGVELIFVLESDTGDMGSQRRATRPRPP
ncbi:MAG: FhaA domain-containing protein [Anaerolineales bacterium]